MKQQNDKTSFLAGLRDGVPIGLGYFAVASPLALQRESGHERAAVFPDVCAVLARRESSQPSA